MLESFGEYGYPRVDYDIAASPSFGFPKAGGRGDAGRGFTLT